MVAETRLTVLVAVVSVRGRRAAIRTVRRRRTRRPPEFFDRAEADAIGLAEGAVDGAGLGDAHFGSVDQGRDVGRISIAISDEALRSRSCVDRRLENPTAYYWITKLTHLLDTDAGTLTASG